MGHCALGATPIGTFAASGGYDLGIIGTLPNPVSPAVFSGQLGHIFGHRVDHAAAPLTETIQTVGMVSGGGQQFHLEAEAAGCDAFISGESGEQYWHQAREGRCHFFACGHSATAPRRTSCCSCGRTPRYCIAATRR